MFKQRSFTRSDPFDDVNSLAESEPHSSVGVASGSSAGDGGGCLDVVGEEDIPEEDLMGSDISVGRDDCKYQRDHTHVHGIGGFKSCMWSPYSTLELSHHL